MKTIKIKARRVSSLLKGLHAIDELQLEKNSIILAVAQNIETANAVMDDLILAEEGIKKDVVDRHTNPLAVPGQQAKLTPEAEVRNRVIELGNQDRELTLVPIQASELFSGKVKPSPSLVSALYPILEGLEQIPD